MGEAIIVGRGAGSSSGGVLKTEIITSNTLWIAPKAIDQRFSVRIFGGGSSGGRASGTSSSDYDHRIGGSGGFMNNGILALLPGQEISITIGSGGRASSTLSGKSGGTTSFGTYLSANGGYTAYNGSYGGSGGGGGTVRNEKSSSKQWLGYAGRGYQFGGGGGYIANYGGYWGGGGGYGINYTPADGGKCIEYDHSNGYWAHNTNAGPFGNGYSGLAGRGGSANVAAEDGTNTIGNANVPDGSLSKFDFHINLQGAGKKGTNGASSSNYYTGGGGGYGGNGGNCAGGGGGYGGNGGDGYKGKTPINNLTIIAGGGGGGYGADGGNAYQGVSTDGNYVSAMGGGGGGYGKSGKGGDGGIKGGNGGYAAGGGGGNESSGSGGNGICIIQYFA